MEKIITKDNYETTLNRIDELLLVVDNNTKPNNPNFIELNNFSDFFRL